MAELKASGAKRKSRKTEPGDELVQLRQRVAELEHLVQARERCHVIVYGTMQNLEILLVSDDSKVGQARQQQVMSQLEQMEPYLPRHVVWKEFDNVPLNLPLALQDSDRGRGGGGEASHNSTTARSRQGSSYGASF
jgi:hypothetical protein